MKSFTRKITKNSSHSYSINIPKEFMKELGWKEKQKLVITDKGRNRLEIKDWKK
ncbi:AbrB/MazE/SpoVT family DNA-binding domain-containing protein [Patescibacteria group bacterium]|nr:AbrB/MazE/SpoVT family DNA-binding domain-containing protein [Patescibacteria group bacterium]